MKIKSEITAPVKVKHVYPGVYIYIRISVSKHIDQKLIFKKVLKKVSGEFARTYSEIYV